MSVELDSEILFLDVQASVIVSVLGLLLLFPVGLVRCISTLICCRYAFISLLFSSMTHWLFSKMWFNLHLFVYRHTSVSSNRESKLLEIKGTAE